MSKTLHYNLLFQPEKGGGFTVIVPALPGCVTYGKDLQDAKKMARDAIAGYLVSLKRHGEPIPSDENSFVASIDVTPRSSKKPSYV